MQPIDSDEKIIVFRKHFSAIPFSTKAVLKKDISDTISAQHFDPACLEQEQPFFIPMASIFRKPFSIYKVIFWLLFINLHGIVNRYNATYLPGLSALLRNFIPAIKE